MRPFYALIVAALALTSCIPRGDRDRRPRVDTPEQLRACLAGLDATGVRYRRLPDRSDGGGCGFTNALQLQQIGIPLTNLGAVTCPVARALTLWVRGPVQTAAREVYGQQVGRVETFGSYSCRTIAGGARLSQHGLANAVDISAFRLADGRTVTIEAGWNGEDERDRRFLRLVRDGGCRAFLTVLSPDYNADHYNHLHFDMGRGPFCR
jgi:hypothetical protein